MAYDTEEHHISKFHDNNTAHLYLLGSCFIMFHSTVAVVVSNDDKGS